jgi:superfamily II DNA helicase RecQ
VFGCQPEGTGFITGNTQQHSGDSPKDKDLKNRKYQILLISPELLLSQRFLNIMMQDKDFVAHILSIMVDKAHVVSHWGAGFRKKCGELGMICTFFCKETPVVAMSATLAARVRQDVLWKLQFVPDHFTMINIGNGQPNVAIVVHAIHNAQNSYINMNFVIPQGVTREIDIPLTMVYADNVASSINLHDHFEHLLPERLKGKGLIRPFSVAFSLEYRTKVMWLFNLGVVCVLVCTDAAGMVSTIHTE